MKWEILHDRGERIFFAVQVESPDVEKMEKIRLQVLREFLEKNERGDFFANFAFFIAAESPSVDYIPASRWFAD